MVEGGISVFFDICEIFMIWPFLDILLDLNHGLSIRLIIKEKGG